MVLEQLLAEVVVGLLQALLVLLLRLLLMISVTDLQLLVVSHLLVVVPLVYLLTSQKTYTVFRLHTTQIL